ncbi:hypothetical protein [Aliidiomarina minuta]|uniref:hypothetical protein n=1 Tax=Aliidiomarina minuta TaxID=880057 RepID=UPI0013005E4A|nr:hypothetical protein [Aliidiomarina minuta]
MLGKTWDFTISIVGLGFFMGGLGASGVLDLPGLLICGVGLGLMLGGIFRAIERKNFVE